MHDYCNILSRYINNSEAVTKVAQLAYFWNPNLRFCFRFKYLYKKYLYVTMCHIYISCMRVVFWYNAKSVNNRCINTKIC